MLNKFGAIFLNQPVSGLAYAPEYFVPLWTETQGPFFIPIYTPTILTFPPSFVGEVYVELSK